MNTKLLWSVILFVARGGLALSIRQLPNSNTFPPINSTQSTSASAFSGSATIAAPLGPQVVIQPAARLLHTTGGNEGFLPFSGPLGNSLKAISYARPMYVAWWGLNKELTTATVGERDGKQALAICATNPDTFQALDCWFPDDATENVNFAYSELILDTNDILLNTAKNNLYVVHRSRNSSTPLLATTRKININDTGILRNGEFLHNGLFDTAGNIWFTTGAAFGNVNRAPVNHTIVGYIEPNGTVHHLNIPDEVIENGIAVSNTTMFIQTAPAGSRDHANAVGQVYAFTTGHPGNTSDVKVVFNATYDAGSVSKPGGFARGSGTTMTLLGNDYISLVDHADIQASVKVYSQKTGQVVCSVPIFSPNKSAVDNGMLVAFDGARYGLIALNSYNTPDLFVAGGNVSMDGAWNNVTGLEPGFARIDVEPQQNGTAKCSVRWNLPLRAKGVATLSSENGLVYAYVQDEKLALQGQWVWYAVAIDFKTGKEVWRIRTGTGGNFNDNFQAATLSPDGRLIQSVQGGVVVVSDGAQAKATSGAAVAFSSRTPVGPLSLLTLCLLF